MVYLKELELENVKCFGKNQPIDFRGTDGKISQWTVILGDNGTGKTTLLKSIVSMLPTPESFLVKRHHLETQYSLSIDNKWGKVWNRSHKDGFAPSKLNLTITETEFPFSDKEEVSQKLSYSETHWFNNIGEVDPEPTFFDTRLFSPVYCFAYGANRKMSSASLAEDNLEHANETLFFDDALLQNAAEYFLRVDYETAKSKSKKSGLERNRVKELLRQVLPHGVKDIRVAKTGRLQREVQVETPFGWVGINELSMGYKTTIAWLIDFATKMIYYHHLSDTPFDEPAILILDEIDLHMHPAWQREIIENLTHIFKKTQFIVTAHSPLIAQAALDANLILIKRVRDRVEVINEPAIIKSWRIDQILTSDLFGLKHSRPDEIERKINRRRDLIKKEGKLTEKEKDELKLLNMEVHLLPVGETKSEIEAMDILRDFAVKLEAAKKKKIK